MLRPESKVRARALQLLYAWELQNQPPIRDVAESVFRLHAGRGREWDDAETMAAAVAHTAESLDAEIGEAAANWRLQRIGVIERNILRLALHELATSETSAKVVISEAMRLAHWFAGSKAGPFINGVLDALARARGRL